MWIQFNDCFFSIVEDSYKKTNLLVRARRRGHLELIVGPDVHIEHTPNRDYLYRCSLPKEKVAMILHDRIATIDYPNFKDSVRSRPLEEPYWNVYSALMEADDRRSTT
ncbi:MAG: hypothetical protein R3F07_04005 [Opitutaceae bacterium]